MSERTVGFMLAFVLPVPALLVAIEPFLLMKVGPRPGFLGALIATVKSFWPSLLIVFGVGLVFAMMAHSRCRRFGLPKRQQFAWAVFVLVLGVPAYAGFLLNRRWPVRLPCPHCQSSAPRDRIACATCGVPFPEPVSKGIEIFA